jgi:uncharacterized protein
MSDASIQQRFTDALGILLERLKEDRSVLAAILCGSLSHDTVWARSDIDLVLVTIDDRKTEYSQRAIFADGVNVHALLMTRDQFRNAVESTIRNSFVHSFLAKGRLLYTHDPTIAGLCAGLDVIGERDAEMQVLAAAIRALGPIYKARKWFLTRGDLDYSALYILYAATSLARVEVIGARRLADREVILDALQLNPRFFEMIYSNLLNQRKTARAVKSALDAVDDYLAQRAPAIFAPVLDHLRHVGEARSCTEIEHHFLRNFGIDGVTAACEYLADQGLLGKASVPVKLTARSNVEIQELAFFHLRDRAG